MTCSRQTFPAILKQPLDIRLVSALRCVVSQSGTCTSCVSERSEGRAEIVHARIYERCRAKSSRCKLANVATRVSPAALPARPRRSTPPLCPPRSASMHRIPICYIAGANVHLSHALRTFPHLPACRWRRPRARAPASSQRHPTARWPHRRVATYTRVC